MIEQYLFPVKQFRRRIIRFRSAGSGTEYVDDIGVKSGQVIKIARVSVENLSNNYTRLRLGPLSGKTFFPVVEQTSPASGQLYWTVDPFILVEDERLRIELVGCTSGDLVNVYIDEFYNEVLNA